MHPDYRARAIEQAQADWNLFAKHSTFMRKEEFLRWNISICELNIHRRTKDDVIHFFSVLENCWKAMFKASHAVSFRIFPASLLYEPRATSAALEHMSNDGYVVAPRNPSRNKNRNNDNDDDNMLVDGLQGINMLGNGKNNDNINNNDK